MTQLPNVKPNRLLGVGDAGVIRSFCQLQAMFAFSFAFVASLTSPRPLELTRESHKTDRTSTRFREASSPHGGYSPCSSTRDFPTCLVSQT